MVGKTFGHYEILEPLGAGGMGEVYRARDKKLKREVAIKVLPQELSADPDRLARLEREAHLLAALNHANIATIHALEEEEGTRFLVLELVKGESLEQRLSRGPLPVENALEVCKQIAEALEAAHNEGIVHRDLKPANVLITPEGNAKVLDFGLAKEFEAAHAETDMSHSPTVTVAGTQAGVILGTAPYMSPEQVRGKLLNKRADIWAFGCVLYEALTGRRAFDRETVADTLAAILDFEPEWNALPVATPVTIQSLLRRCLRKNQDRRLRDIGDARIEIDDALADPHDGSGASRGVAVGTATTGVARVVPWAVAAAALAVAVWAWTARAPDVAGGHEFAISAPVGSQFRFGFPGGVISPDGTKVAFVARTDEVNRLWVRPLAEDSPVALPGTEGALQPFWSADSARLAFFSGGALKTVDIAGGLPEDIAEAPQPRGGSWGADGTIVFTPDSLGTVHKVADTGGDVENLTTHDAGRGETTHYWPHMLPDGERFLFFARGDTAENSGIYLARLDGTGIPTRVVASMSSGIYAPAYAGFPGHLLWVRDGSLLAQPFDLDAGVLTGSATVITTDVRVDELYLSLFASVSDNGVLAWATASAVGQAANWYNRQGLRTGSLEIEPGRIRDLDLSPKGERLLHVRIADGDNDIYLYDTRTGETRAVVADPGLDQSPLWSAGGESFFYSAARGLIIADPDGLTGKRTVYAGDRSGNQWPARPSVDNKYLLFDRDHPQGGFAIVAARVEGGEDPKFLTEATSDREFPLGFSPDGEWLLLRSMRSGAYQLYAAPWRVDAGVARLGEPAQWRQISTSGPGRVQWTTDGEVLFPSAGSMMSVPVTQSGADLGVGRESRLFRIPDGANVAAIARDGQRFVLTTAPYAAGQTIRVLTNWQSRLAEGR